MADLSIWTGTGRLTRDAVQKAVGVGLTEFDIALTTGFGDRQQTVYITCNMWGKQGEGVFPYLTKGKPVGVSGELSINTWTDRTGKENTKLTLQVSKMTFLPDGKGKKEEDAPVPEKPKKGKKRKEDTDEYWQDVPY